MATQNLCLLSTFLLLLLLLLLLDFSINAVSQSMVRYLPGFVGPLPFDLETGYVSVDDTEDVQLYYYFVKSERNPAEDPLILWITGGPGCSGLSALFFEIGPLHIKIVKYNGSLPTLELNPYSWTKVSNIIFLDTPVGTGFSYSRTLLGSYSSDTKSAQQACTFITKWLINHPEFLSNPLYVGGDSYSGKTVPIVVQDISDGIEADNKPILNIKGYILGNAVTDPHMEVNSRIPYAHGMGLLSDELFESVKRSCGEDYVNVDPSNVQCKEDLQVVSECTSGVNSAHILEPLCLLVAPKPKMLIKHRRSLEENLSRAIFSPPGVPELQCRSYGYMLAYYWANDDRVQEALHVRKGTTKEWIRCSYGGAHYSGDVKTSTSYHLSLSGKHVRSLMYNGDHDMLVTFVSSQTWIRSLNFSLIDEWRPWLVDGQVAGYTRKYSNNMTFATIKGGGHTAPEYRPKECLAMLNRWLSHEPL